MADSILHYELKLKDCAAELWLNGIPVRRMDSREQNFASAPALTFLVSGRNVLEMVVFPGIPPSRAREAPSPRQVPASASAWGRVARLDVGGITGDEQAPALAELRYRAADRPDELYPWTPRAEFEFQTGLQPWVWQRAELINLARDRTAIVETIRVVHQAFAVGDPAPILQRSGIYLEEEARALPFRPAADLADRMRRDIAQNAGRTSWVAPLIEEEFDLRVCAGNRLVECISKRGKSLIDTLPQPDGSIYPFPMFLGRIGRDWMILR